MTKTEVFLPLSQGKVAVIDFEDFEKVRGFKWYAQKAGSCFYACRDVWEGGNRTKLFLHRFLTNCPPDLEVHHINGDGLDNRQENLQICTAQQHRFARQRKKADASSKCRGVSWSKRYEEWRARIGHHGVTIHLGYFDSEEDAARAYDAKATELFGEFAAPNFCGGVSSPLEPTRA